MDDYYVTVRSKSTEEDFPSRWSMHFKADNFAHAEYQAKDALKEEPDAEIITIEKDY